MKKRPFLRMPENSIRCGEKPMWFTHRIFRAITSITLVVFSTTVCTPLIAAI
jgi:hypothetical protein